MNMHDFANKYECCVEIFFVLILIKVIYEKVNNINTRVAT